MDTKKNKLTIETLKKEELKSKENKEITLSNGDYLNIKPVLDKDDVEKIINDYSSFLLDKDVKDVVLKKELFLYLQCFIILNNSDLLENLELNNNVDKLKFSKLILNNVVLFDEIINSFDIKSIELIVKKFSNILKMAKQLEKVNATKERKQNLKKKKK